MPLTVSFSGGFEQANLRRTFEGAFKVMPEDFRYALERQRERILSRTAQGLDAGANPFAPYSEKGPYYYYPTKGSKEGHQRSFGFVKQQEIRRRSAAAGRLMRKMGFAGRGSQVPFKFAEGKIHRGRGSVGIRFESYAAFKRALGRTNVDLLGPSAPHMLQALQVVKVTPQGGTLGIYGQEADRATGHNEGASIRNLPKREFFAFSERDVDAVVKDIDEMLGRRLAKDWA
jgi:hypothetical protein